MKRMINKGIIRVIVILVLIIIATTLFKITLKYVIKEKKVKTITTQETSSIPEIQEEIPQDKKEEKDWRLLLVNKENKVPDDYNPELANIEEDLFFDVRAVDELKQMLVDMKEDGVTGIWIQSSYRTIERQEKLFQNKVKEYRKQGYSEEEAEKLAQTIVQKPENSEHNIALSVDFNYVNEEFDKTKAFQWLEENAMNYGFILRYPKDKIEITGVNYEPWHWRYVGKEHAKEIKKQGYCLEEYVKVKRK